MHVESTHPPPTRLAPARPPPSARPPPHGRSLPCRLAALRARGVAQEAAAVVVAGFTKPWEFGLGPNCPDVKHPERYLADRVDRKEELECPRIAAGIVPVAEVLSVGEHKRQRSVVQQHDKPEREPRHPVL